MQQVLWLDGNSLTIIQLVQAINNRSIKITITQDARTRIIASHNVIQNMITNKEIVYGVTTGFGSLKRCVIDGDDIVEMQKNLIVSHAVGSGSVISHRHHLAMLLLRINTLAKGFSGVSLTLIEYLINRYNQGIYGEVFEQGSCGASGDLAPLSHLVLGYLGYGNLWDPQVGAFMEAETVLTKYNIDKLVLGPKEGLALNNGTTFMTAHLALLIDEIEVLFNNANVIAAITIEALFGTMKAFEPQIHATKGHVGQIQVAQEILSYLRDSDRQASSAVQNNVQDAYSLRCIPQVHGPILETIMFCKAQILKEMNSATDNPLVFTSEVASATAGTGRICSAGNFHGQGMASVADFLSIQITTLGNISERRHERLVNGQLSNGLPSFLIDPSARQGLNSGFMITQYNSAALCAENRTLSNPSSVHSIPTCENVEDFVSMGATAVVKLGKIVGNVRRIIANELYSAVQGFELGKDRTETGETATARVIDTSPILQAVIDLVRTKTTHLDRDRYMKPEIDALTDLIRDSLIWWCKSV